MVKQLMVFGILLSLHSIAAQDKQPKVPGSDFSIESGKSLELSNATTKSVQYLGKSALQLEPQKIAVNESCMAIVPKWEFETGTIEVELSGEPSAKADPGARGFIGIAFHIDANDPKNFRMFYLRPTNARANDQLRRNHTVQYVASPDYSWARLRKEFPGVYESYADMVPGHWTKMKIVVESDRAMLYINDADQPCLIVNDFKNECSKGKIALWSHSWTIAHFRNLKVTPNQAEK